MDHARGITHPWSPFPAKMTVPHLSAVKMTERKPIREEAEHQCYQVVALHKNGFPFGIFFA